MFPNTPPFRWLVQALATRWESGAVPLPSAEGEDFWDGVKRLAFRHRVVGVLDHQARAHPDLVPRPVQFWLTASAQTEALKSQVLLPEVAAAARALNAAGLPFLVLQGWGLIAGLYHGDLAQRATTDLDLFFPPRARAESLRVLEGLGYFRYRVYPRPGFTARYERVEFLRHPSAALVADAHYAFADIPALWPRIGADWYARCRWVDLPGCGSPPLRLPLPPPAGLLLYQAVHLFSHYSSARLFHYYDLALLARQPGLDWDSFTAQALKSGMPGPLSAVLRRLESWWPGSLPSGLLPRLEARADPAFLRPYYARVLRGKPALGWAMLLKVLTLPGLKKLTCLLEYVFPDRAYLHSRYRLPANASWLRGWLRHLASNLQRLVK